MGHLLIPSPKVHAVQTGLLQALQITQNAEPCSTFTSSAASPPLHRYRPALLKTSASALPNTTPANHPTPRSTGPGTSKPTWPSPNEARPKPSNAISKALRESLAQESDCVFLRLFSTAQNALRASQSKQRTGSLQSHRPFATNGSGVSAKNSPTSPSGMP
jgi:hypothetical protein